MTLSSRHKRLSKVTIDTENNRLNITFIGSISKEEMENIYTDLHVCVPELQPGFNVLTDISNCTIIHLSGAPTFQKIMEFLLENNVGKTVRVVGKQKLPFNQLSRISEKSKEYIPINVSTIEEAEEIFSSSSDTHA